jgi:hypothetical protein
MSRGRRDAWLNGAFSQRGECTARYGAPQGVREPELPACRANVRHILRFIALMNRAVGPHGQPACLSYGTAVFASAVSAGSTDPEVAVGRGGHDSASEVIEDGEAETGPPMGLLHLCYSGQADAPRPAFRPLLRRADHRYRGPLQSFSVRAEPPIAVESQQYAAPAGVTAQVGSSPELKRS